jgi:ketosteroid isomerase-like protein
MAQEAKHEPIAAAMRRINRLWLDGDVDALAPMVHPDIAMVFPGFTGRIEGREDFLGGFRDFCQNTKIREFRDYDHHVDVAGDTAVVTFLYEMVYERSGERYRATGRDLWVFQSQGGEWVTVWRAMLDTQEQAA